MTSFNMILPELNDFITNLNGENYKGLIITVFTISAAFARPFSGKLSDVVGRKFVMYVGVLISVIVCLLYPLSTSVWFFLSLRLVHGFSAGFTPTGATALMTDIIPENKRGVGMGIWGTFISLGIGLGQASSTFVVSIVGVNGLFMVASMLAVFSSLFMFKVEETLELKNKYSRSYLKITWKDVIEPAVLPSAIVIFLSAISSGIIFVMSADLSKFLHINNKGWFFMFYVISTIVLRLFTARLSDVIGRRKTLLIGMSILVVSMFMIAIAKDIFWYTTGAITFGLATGVSSPTLFAWTADLSPAHRRGVGSGTMMIALEFGIMFGSSATLLLYDNTPNTVFSIFIFGMVFAFIAILYLLWLLWKNKGISIEN